MYETHDVMALLRYATVYGGWIIAAYWGPDGGLVVACLLETTVQMGDGYCLLIGDPRKPNQQLHVAHADRCIALRLVCDQVRYLRPWSCFALYTGARYPR